VVALFNITGWHLCSAYGLTLVQAGRGAIIAYTMPLWTVVFGRLLIGELITPSRAAALGLGLAGMAVLVTPDLGAIRAAPAGALLVLGAAVSWAIGTVLTKARRWTVPTAVLTGWQLLVGAVPIVLGAAIRWGAGAASVGGPDGPSTAAVLGTAYATFVGVIFCHWAWFRIVAMLPAAVAAIGTLGVPVLGLLTSALVLGEPIGAIELVALVLVVGALGILVGGLRAPGTT
jgi:drug/metabolite transporter (DMT)-like permease